MNYLTLAGGIIPENSNKRRIFFLDGSGERKKVSLETTVPPGSIIYVDKDGWGHFKQFATESGILTGFIVGTFTSFLIYFAIDSDGAIPWPWQRN